MDALTPNTSAFLSMLSDSLSGNNADQTNYDENAFNPFNVDTFNDYNPTPASVNVKTAPSSLPPSAFFPIPGRDTPEDTPPSTNEASQSPEKIVSPITRVHKTTPDASGDSDADHMEKGNRRASVNHKRKAGLGNQRNKHVEEEEEDDFDDSDDGDEHEDKRVHQNGKTPGGPKKGGRKSAGAEEGKGGKENKAARRKEQNRAAQKAFRERREAKVKDLEDKVAELERKSYGTSVENENLRGILKRLQEENVALRQAAFTFSMPVNGQTQSGNATGASTPVVSVPQRPQSKPLSPPNSTDDVLQSINDISSVQSRKTSHAVADSPDSLHSIGSGSRSGSTGGAYRSPPNLFQGTPNAFDLAALGGGGRPGLPTQNSGSSNTTQSTSLRSNSGVSPASTSTSSNGRTELDALWASFLQQGAPQKDQSPPAWNVNSVNQMGAFDTQANGMSFADPNTKISAQGTTNSSSWDKLAFRDGSAQQVIQPNFQQSVPGIQPPAGTQQADPWSGMMDNSMDDFLASLTGGNNTTLDNDSGLNDDDFNTQLQQILGSNNASPSNAFAVPGFANPFSPTNYLNMSPSPLVSASASNEPSPQTHSGSSVSASASPESLIGTNDTSRDASLVAVSSPAGKDGAEHLYVVDESGKVIKPSELWIKMGMQHESDLEHLLIDDLCDMMRSKATCKDGKAIIQARDAENLFRYKSNDPVHNERMSRLEQRAGIAPGAFTQPH